MLCLVPAALVLTLVSVWIATTAFAGVYLSTIHPVAIVSDNGHHVIVTGPIGCTASERNDLRVTVTQRSTGAMAEGHAFITCAGNIQQWEVVASTQGHATFQEGPATVVALALTTVAGQTTDAHQWLVNITLAKE